MPLRLLITSFFLLSGATGLVYQVLWVRMLGLVVGHSALAIATVVATFMAGLGLGARLAGRRADRIARPLAAYGVLEVIIGVLALATPLLFAVVDSLGLGASIATVPLAAMVLLPPTLAMGATLPLLTRWYARDAASLGADMGWLYAINTTGAVVGAALAGFVLLPILGQPITLGAAAVTSVLVGLGAILVGRRHPLAPPRAAVPLLAPTGVPTAPAPPQGAVLAAFALSGAAALLNQVAWTRCFELFVGSTTYAFSLIVAAFIGGLALGGHAASRIVDRLADRVGLLAGLNVGVALVCALLIPLLGELPLLLLEPIAALDGFGPTQAFVFSVLFALVLIPTALMGATYPVATRILAPDPETAAEAVGRAYAWNTGGAVLGSIAAGLVLIPILALQGSLWLAVVLNLAAAAVLVGDRRRAAVALPLIGVLGWIASPDWNPRHLNLAPHIYADDLVAAPELLAAMRDSGSVVFHEEGRGATVTVIQRHTGARVLRINGKTDASTQDDRVGQTWLGRLPMVLHGAPRSAFVLGLGSGMSLAPVLEVPGLERLIVAELLPEVARAATHFGPLLGDPLDDPRTQVLIEDGRHTLHASPSSFDVVMTQPTNLFVSGMSTLCTVEAFEAVRRALRPGGVALVWVQGYLLPEADFHTLARTFQHVFPGATLWNAHPYDYALVATADGTAPILDRDRLQAALQATNGGRGALWTGLQHPEDLQRHYVLSPDGLRAWAGPGPVQRDADPFLEFSAPRGLYGADGVFVPGPLLADRELLPLPGADPDRLRVQREVDRALLDPDPAAVLLGYALDPGNQYAAQRVARHRYDQALAALQAGRPDRAEALAQESSANDPSALPPRQLRAVALHGLGRTEEGLDWLRRGVELQPWNPYSWLVLADFHEGIGQPAEARAATARAATIDPALPELSAAP